MCNYRRLFVLSFSGFTVQERGSAWACVISGRVTLAVVALSNGWTTKTNTNKGRRQTAPVPAMPKILNCLWICKANENTLDWSRHASTLTLSDDKKLLYPRCRYCSPVCRPDPCPITGFGVVYTVPRAVPATGTVYTQTYSHHESMAVGPILEML